MKTTANNSGNGKNEKMKKTENIMKKNKWY